MNRTERIKQHLGLGNSRRRAAHEQDVRTRQQYLDGRDKARMRDLDERGWESGAMRSAPGRTDERPALRVDVTPRTAGIFGRGHADQRTARSRRRALRSTR